MKFLHIWEQARWQNIRLGGCLALALCLNALTLLGWMHTQSRVRVYLPPAIPQSGLTVTRGVPPKSTVYSFAWYIWQRLNHWSSNGQQDYQRQIQQLTPYLTATFKQQLIADYNQRLTEGELQDRLRFLSTAGPLYTDQIVKQINAHQWQVALTVHLIERINSNARIVKEANVRYVLTVVKKDVDAKQNPWGLALAGFAAAPARLAPPSSTLMMRTAQ